MGISYKKLFDLMQERGIKKSDLRNDYHINHKVVNRLVHDRSVTTNSIIRLCEILDCQPGDIMEYIKETDKTVA